MKLNKLADNLRTKANEDFQKGNYIDAIENYTKAIVEEPKSSILYGNRAAALMKRDWLGLLISHIAK